jgi:hypothetical protein
MIILYLKVFIFLHADVTYRRVIVIWSLMGVLSKLVFFDVNASKKHACQKISIHIHIAKEKDISILKFYADVN